MSRAALIVALAVAAALAVTAAVLLRPPSGANNAAPLRFDPANVTSLSVTGPDASRTLARQAQGWIFTLRRADGAGFAHHADSVKVQAALTALAATARLGESAAPDPRGATTIEVTLTDGSIKIVVGASPLGGRVPVAVTRGPSTTDAFLAPLEPFQPLTGTGSSDAGTPAFLDPAVFRWTGVPVSMTLAHGSTRIRAERTGRAWMIREPLDTSADMRAMGMLQAALANLTLSEASPVPPVSAAGTPAFSISFTEEGPNGATHALVGSSDGTGSAILTGPLGSVRVVLRDPDLDLLTPKVTTLINHYALPFPAADITKIRVTPPGENAATPRVLARDAEAWTLDGTTLQGSSLGAASALTRLLGSQTADLVSLDAPTDFVPVATLSVDLRVSEQPFTFTIGTSVPPAAAAGGKSLRVLTVVAGPISRLYRPGDDEALMAFLTTLARDAGDGP
jgi:hypothetical protein